MHDHTRCVVHPPLVTQGFDSLSVPVYRGSTIVFANAEAYAKRGARGHKGYTYGLYGSPTTRALEQTLTALEGGAWTFLLPSGQAANAFGMLPFVKQGDRVLLADTAYPPVRDFAQTDLARMGVEAVFFDPMSPEDVARKIDARTRIVWCESPGSTTMEIQDLPKIAEIAHRHGALVGCDNTWATPLHFKPIAHGADLVTEALTKFAGGHSDLLLGSLTVAREDLIAPIRGLIGRMGIGVSPDDAALVLRGMETMAVRLGHSAAVALEAAAKLQANPLVARVLHPALPGAPGHDIWKRDFLGASGVFSVVFVAEAVPHVEAALDALKLFAIGASWGGTRSLAAPMPVKRNRSATHWKGDDLVLRLSIGLEDKAELLADLDRLLAAIAAACRKAG